MDFLASLFVQKSPTRVAVTAGFGTQWSALRKSSCGAAHRLSAPLGPAAAWTLCAFRVGAVTRFSPEAKKRIGTTVDEHRQASDATAGDGSAGFRAR